MRKPKFEIGQEVFYLSGGRTEIRVMKNMIAGYYITQDPGGRTDKWTVYKYCMDNCASSRNSLHDWIEERYLFSTQKELAKSILEGKGSVESDEEKFGKFKPEDYKL